VADVIARGYSVAVLPSLRVHHTGGAYYATESKEKLAYWERWKRRRARRERLKRVLFRVPLLERLHARRRAARS
jgi:hypothetical protein